MRITDLLAANHRPLMADGAFCTYLRALTHNDVSCALANLEYPQLVREIHQRYLQAGSQVLYSNTFGANSRNIADEERLKGEIEAGLALAAEAAGQQAAVMADIGDCGIREPEQAAEEYLRLAQLFVAAGARDFVFESMGEFTVLQPALSYIRTQCPDAFLLVTFAVAQDGYSKKGLYYQDLLDEAFACMDISASGLNCVCGPGHMVRLLAAYPFEGRLIAALPNAGYPVQVERKLIFEDNEDYYAARLVELAALGCFMVGGCCGTTPGHIAKAVANLAKPAPTPPLVKVGGQRRSETTAKKAALAKLPSLVVELNPPISRDITHFMSAAQAVRAAGAQMVSITDSPLARARADSLMLAAKLRRELNLEVLPHLSCRDRNRLGLKSALLAAAIEGMQYVLVVRGDTADDGVFSLSSRELMAFISSLNREVLAPGGFCVGGALNINAANFAAELNRARAKQKAGCQFFLTQPVSDEVGAKNTELAAQTLTAPVLAGILPVAGYKNALFLQQEVSGIHIPDSLLAQLQAAGSDEEQARAVSVGHCREMMRRLKPHCGGFYLMTPLNKVEWVCELIAEARS